MIFDSFFCVIIHGLPLFRIPYLQLSDQLRLHDNVSLYDTWLLLNGRYLLAYCARKHGSC